MCTPSMARVVSADPLVTASWYPSAMAPVHAIMVQSSRAERLLSTACLAPGADAGLEAEGAQKVRWEDLEGSTV